VGTRATADQFADISQDELLSLLLTAKGFDFIPLKEKHHSENQEIVNRPGLFTAELIDFGKGLDAKVTRLENPERMLRPIVYQADKLVLDPIESLSPLQPDTRGCPR
jgi:hypothetical protein